MSLKEKDIAGVEIPLPPVIEQERIVARIEELSRKIEDACELRTEVTRETCAVTESAKRILLGDPKTNSLAWPTRPLRDIAELRYGISAAISGATDPYLGMPIVRMANIALDGTLDLSDLRYYSMNDREKAVFSLRPGDLLLNWRSGSPAHVGKTAIFEAEGEYTFASFLLRIRVNTEHVLTEFLKLVLNFMRSEGVFLDSQRFQVNTKLNAEEFGDFEIILPPLPEQRRIVDHLDDLQERVDALKVLQAETSLELDALMPSILDKAFRGEL